MEACIWGGIFRWILPLRTLASQMERPQQRNVDDPNVTWENLALSEIDGQPNAYKVRCSTIQRYRSGLFMPWNMLHIPAQVTFALRDHAVQYVMLLLSSLLHGMHQLAKLRTAQVASVGEVQARHLLQALAEDRRTARTPETRQYKSVLSLVNVPGWEDRTVLNMIASNWVFQPYTPGVLHHTRALRTLL